MHSGLDGVVESLPPGHGDDFQFRHLCRLKDVGSGGGSLNGGAAVDLVVSDESLVVILPVRSISQFVDAVVDGLAGRGAILRNHSHILPRTRQDPVRHTSHRL